MIKLGEDEKILFIVLKHWFVLLKETIFLSFLLFLPFAIIFIFSFLNKNFNININGNIIILFIFASSIFFFFLWIIFFIIWTDYYLDILIITNEHIIDVEQKGLFSRELSTFRLDKIQDMTAETNGIIQTLLSFGTIHIQTAGEDRDFIIRGIPKPFDVKYNISQQQDVIMNELKTVNLSEQSLNEIKQN